jgi:DNA-binding NtrC family response regulator
VDLARAAKEGRFREDLFYRIAVYRIQLPPLRERGEDIVNIANYFVRSFARDFKRDLQGFDDRAQRALLEYEWPGNIRELRNVIEQAVVREDGNVLTSWSILPALGMTPGSPAAGEAPRAPGGAGGVAMDSFSGTFEEARKQFEREYLIHQIGLNKGNMKATSEAIGLSRKALYLKCEEYGIDYTAFR